MMKHFANDATGMHTIARRLVACGMALVMAFSLTPLPNVANRAYADHELTIGIQAGNVASATIGGTTNSYETLKAAIDAANSGSTNDVPAVVKLLDDISALRVGNDDSQKFRITGNVTFDLNGHSVTFEDWGLFAQKNVTDYNANGTIKTSTGIGKLTVTDSSPNANGTVTAPYNTLQANDGGTIIVEKGNVVATGEGEIAVAVFDNSTVEVNGGTISAKGCAIANSGQTATSAPTYGGHAIIRVNGGTLTAASGPAIYVPAVDDSTTTISGGTITGATGVEVRGGSLIVTDGTIKGAANVLSCTSNPDGSTTSGAGIAVVEHVHHQAINVRISNGANTVPEISGVCALYQAEPETGSNTADLVSMTVSGGKFKSSVEPVIQVAQNENVPILTGFVTGGEYGTLVPQAYLAANYVNAKSTATEGYPYAVSTVQTVARPTWDTIKELVQSGFTIASSKATSSYTGSAQTVAVLTGAERFELAPENPGTTATAPGNYSFRLVPALGHTWTDEGREPVSLPWEITQSIDDPRVFVVFKANSPLEYTGKQQVIAPVAVYFHGFALESNQFTVKYLRDGKETNDLTSCGEITVRLSGQNGYTGTKDEKVVITRKKVTLDDAVTVLATQPYTYTAAEQTAVRLKDGVSWAQIDGTFKATNAGSYTAKVKLSDTANYEWDSSVAANEAGEVEISWSIAKATIDGYEITPVSAFYTGADLSSSITHTVKSGNAVVDSSEYDIVYTPALPSAGLVGPGSFTSSIVAKENGNYVTAESLPSRTFAVNDVVMLDHTSFVYDGTPQEPKAVTVVWGDKVLTKDADYTVAITGPDSKHIAAGTYSVEVTGKSGTDYASLKASKEYVVERHDVNNADITVGGLTGNVYTGSNLTPVTLSLDGKALSSTGDYDIQYMNNKNAGTATALIMGKGNFDGSKVATFVIDKCTISKVELSPTTAKYDGGKSVTPTVTVRDKAGNVVAPSLYSVSFKPASGSAASEVSAVGTYTVSVAPKDTANYFVDSSATATFTVTDESGQTPPDEPGGNTDEKLTEIDVPKAVANLVYNGDAQTGVSSGTGYSIAHNTATDAGNYSAAVTPNDGYAWKGKTGAEATATAEVSWSIAPKQVTKPVGVTNAAPTGSYQVVVYGGEGYALTLPAGTVATKDAVGNVIAASAGSSGSVTATLNGNNYIWHDRSRATVEVSWSIAASASTVTPVLAASFASGQSSYAYTGSAIRPAIEVRNAQGSLLVAGTDYRIAYSDNVNVGTARAVVTGLGAYQAARPVTLTFQVMGGGKRITSVGSIPNQEYTGHAITPELSVKCGSDTLSSDDYKVTYKNNRRIGTATVTVSGDSSKGYSGRIVKTFKINPKATKIRGLAVTKKRFTVKWAKRSGVDGYEIQYSAEKKFRGSKTTVKVKGASSVKKRIAVIEGSGAKTRYVRVRTYAATGGVTYYSSYTNAKKVKLK